MPPTVLWDFDGTLAFRSGWWGDCLVEILDEHEPGHGLEAAVFHPSMQQGFPWHDWEQAREGLDADAWWRPIEAIAHRAFETAGLDAERSARYAPLVRSTYLRFERWQLFPDTERALKRLRAPAGATRSCRITSRSWASSWRISVSTRWLTSSGRPP